MTPTSTRLVRAISSAIGSVLPTIATARVLPIKALPRSNGRSARAQLSATASTRALTGQTMTKLPAFRVRRVTATTSANTTAARMTGVNVRLHLPAPPPTTIGRPP